MEEPWRLEILKQACQKLCLFVFGALFVDASLELPPSWVTASLSNVVGQTVP